VTFAGMVEPGVYQLDIVAPEVAKGDAPVTIELAAGARSPDGAYLAIGR